MTKITYLGHAALLLENKDLTLLQDPWLDGPACFNGWYHFPRAVSVNKIRKPTHIYISHSHQDHLSKETLYKIDKRTEIILAHVDPEYKGQPPVREQIESLGFKNITQLRNFETMLIGKTKITMLINEYDSGICIQDTDCTVLNTNDCVIEPIMGKMKAKFSPIDIAFMIPIAASHYPQCYRFEDVSETKYHAHLRTIARFIQRAIYLQPKIVVPYACMQAHFLDEQDHLKNGLTAYDSLKLMKPFIYPYNKFGPKIKPILMSPSDYWTTKNGYHKINKFDWANIEKEYKSAKRFYDLIIKERIDKKKEITYTSVHNKPVEIKKIIGDERNQFKINFVKFMKRVLTTINNENFKVQFDFGWYKSLIDFKRKKIITNKDDWDVRMKIPPHLFNFFMENPAEWGNVLQSYRIRIDVKKGHRSSEYALQKCLLNAYTIPKR